MMPLVLDDLSLLGTPEPATGGIARLKLASDALRLMDVVRREPLTTDAATRFLAASRDGECKVGSLDAE
jgi:hypothetical protein